MINNCCWECFDISGPWSQVPFFFWPYSERLIHLQILLLPRGEKCGAHFFRILAHFPHFLAKKRKKRIFPHFPAFFSAFFLKIWESAHFFIGCFCARENFLRKFFGSAFFVKGVKNFEKSKFFQKVKTRISWDSGWNAELKNHIFIENRPTYPDFWSREAPVPRK